MIFNSVRHRISTILGLNSLHAVGLYIDDMNNLKKVAEKRQPVGTRTLDIWVVMRATYTLRYSRYSATVSQYGHYKLNRYVQRLA